MRRHAARVLLALFLGIVPMAVGLLTVLTSTQAGRDLLARDLSVRLSRLLRGHFELGAIEGSFLRDLTIDSLVVHDTSGALLASIPRLEVGYTLPNFLARRVILNRVRLVSPTIRIIKHRNGRMNYEEVLRLGEGKPGGPPGPLVEFRNLRVSGASLRVEMPWTPPDSVRTAEGAAAALAADRAQPGRVIEESPEGLRKILIFDPLVVNFRTVRVATPDHLPLTFDIDSLATRLNDPGLRVTSLVAHGWTAGDSLAFTVTRGSLPATAFRGGGVVTWPKGPMLFDFGFDLGRVDLKDLRWISPNFPDLSGRALVVARSASETHTSYWIRDLHLAGRSGKVDGELTAITDQARGLGVDGLNLAVEDFDLNVVRPYLDTLPLHGMLTGTTVATGFFDQMAVDLDWDFQDSTVEGLPVSHVTGSGQVELGGPQGFVFDSFDLARSEIDLRTVRKLSPGVVVEGSLRAAGHLTGPWRDVRFEGEASQQDGDRPVSRLRGVVTLDTRRDTLGLGLDADLDPLSFDGIRRGFPGLRTRGALQGHVRASGMLDNWTVDADLHGELGAVHAVGRVAILPGRLGADSLSLTLEQFDLDALRGEGPATSLSGRILVSGVSDSGAAPDGRLEARLGRGWVREFTFDSIETRVAVHDSLITLDTLRVDWPSGRADGAGTLGWARSRNGQMRFAGEAATLAVFDSLVTVLSGVPPDTAETSRPLGGDLQLGVALSGSLDSLRADLDASAHRLTWHQLRAPSAVGQLTWLGGARPRIATTVTSDSLTWGRWLFREFGATVAGFTDSLDWSGGTGIGEASRLHGGGRLWRGPGAPVLAFDSLTADLPAHPWRLARPVEVTLSDSAFDLSSLALEAEDGSGSVRLDGRLPRNGPGDMTLAVLGLDLRDVYGLLQWDTSQVAGTLTLDIAIGGTARAPVIQGTGSLGDASFGEFNAPFVQMVMRYQGHELDANLLLWKTGEQALRVEARLPLDLALEGVPRRQLDGPISVRALADSTDLGMLEAFTPSIRRVRGSLAADAEIGGTWNQPRLAGFIQVTGGAVSIPGLGVRFSGINGRARLAGDSITLDSLRLDSGRGSLAVEGATRLEGLTRPELALTLNAREFRAIDVRSLLTLDASGRVSLTGPVFNARLTGSVTANTGVLHFADLVTKRIVDLENPADSGLIDLSLIKAQKLGAAFQSRFLDSLRIDNLSVQMGESFWLRSSEANIQLDGTVTANKIRSDYRFDGTLNALRGNYTLKIGFVTRDFVVERGTVRYFGTPDLNAELDIQARHTVRTRQGNEEVPVIAKITGTILAPKLTLESTQRPPLSETELVSYLMFGTPSFSLSSSASTAGQGTDQLAAVQTAVSYLSSALSSEIQRTVISDLGVPLDYFSFRPGGQSSAGDPQTGAGSVTQIAQLAAGWRIGRKTFLTVNADLCTNQTRLYPELEYRFSGQLRVKASFEPTYPCTAFRPIDQLSGFSKYQIGFDLLWEREQ